MGIKLEGSPRSSSITFQLRIYKWTLCNFHFINFFIKNKIKCVPSLTHWMQLFSPTWSTVTGEDSHSSTCRIIPLRETRLDAEAHAPRQLSSTWDESVGAAGRSQQLWCGGERAYTFRCYTHNNVTWLLRKLPAEESSSRALWRWFQLLYISAPCWLTFRTTGKFHLNQWCIQAHLREVTSREFVSARVSYILVALFLSGWQRIRIHSTCQVFYRWDFF